MGSEMCIRDRVLPTEVGPEDLGEHDLAVGQLPEQEVGDPVLTRGCLLYTSDAADDLLCVDLGGRRIIKKIKRRLHATKYIFNTSITKIMAITQHT